MLSAVNRAGMSGVYQGLPKDTAGKDGCHQPTMISSSETYIQTHYLRSAYFTKTLSLTANEEGNDRHYFQITFLEYYLCRGTRSV